jgi:predicted HTH transcriptional regulator
VVKIKNESELNNWFKNNYRKLGFEEMIRHDIGVFPDIIMKKGGEKIRVELEIKSSNFIAHKHRKEDVDTIICIDNDIELGIPTIELKNFKLTDFRNKTPYSYESLILKLFEKEEVVTSSDVAKFLKVSWNTANSYLKDLVIEGILKMKKKEGVTLWMKK